MQNTSTQFIPAGRTARMKRGDSEVQLQTEYAPRPSPRITSSILISGELIHKIETPLESPIETQEQLERVERLMLRQHGDALKALKGQSESSRFSFETMKVRLKERDISKDTKNELQRSRPISSLGSKENAQLSEMVQKAENAVPFGDQPLSQSDKIRKVKRTTLERLYEIEGVDNIITTDWKGRFLSEKAEKDFKKQFSTIYKHLAEALEIFSPLENGKGREEGIYEAVNRRLYMVSHCGYIYFLIMRRIPADKTIEETVREALSS